MSMYDMGIILAGGRRTAPPAQQRFLVSRDPTTDI